MLKCIVMLVINIEKSKKSKMSYIFTLSLYIVNSTCGHE